MNDFECFLQQKGLAGKTISRHQREVKKFQSWLDVTNSQSAEFASKKQLLSYLQHLKEGRNLSNDSLDNILKILKNYYRYLAKNQGVLNITSFIKIRGTRRSSLRSIFTSEQLDVLCDAYYYHIQEYCPSSRELGFYPNYSGLLLGRYIALTLVAYQGLLIHEVLSLNQASFDLRKATVTIDASRRGASRTLALEASQIGVLIQYFDEGNQGILPNLNHFEKLSKTLKEITRKPSSKMTRFEDFRQIRASKITHWIKLYGLRKAQYLAGHRNILGTEKYVANDIEHLHKDMDNFHPL